MLKAPNCLNGFLMVLIKPSLFSISDLLTAFSFASAEILSSETFVSLIYHCYSFGSLPSAVQHTALWELVEPLWSRFPERTKYKLRNLCPHSKNSTVLSLLPFLPPTCSLSPLLSLSPFSFWATGSRGWGEELFYLPWYATPPSPWSQLNILFFWVDYHKYFITVAGS